MPANRPSHAGLTAWRAAQSLSDIGECMAQWLTGSLTYQPGEGRRPAAETLPHVAELAAINRAGLVTDSSQPGALWRGGGQRAYLTGFCSFDTADRLLHFLLMTDHVVLPWEPDEECRTQLVVSARSRREHTWLGRHVRTWDDLIDVYADALCENGLTSMMEACQIALVDPIWGRPNQLFEAVLHALKASGPLP